MKMGGWVVGAALLLSGAPLVAANGKDPVALEPSMPWKIHSTGDFCRLWRSFGTGKQAITVVLDNFDNDEDFRITLAGRPMLAAKRDGSVQLRFGDALPEQSLAFDSGTFARKPAWIVKTAIRIRPDPDGTDPRPITPRKRRRSPPSASGSRCGSRRGSTPARWARPSPSCAIAPRK